MKKFLMSGLIVLLLLGLNTGADATLINPGFETGNLTGWGTTLASGSAAVVTSHYTTYDPAITYYPTEGSYFLALQTGYANYWQQTYQSLSLGAGETLSGTAAFNWGDYMPFADGVKVEILNASGSVVATPFYMDGSMVSNSGYNGPWTNWSWTAAAAGTYTLVYAARNTLDGGGPNQTFGYFDATTVTNVPEPATMLLLGFGLAGLAGLRRKFSN